MVYTNKVILRLKEDTGCKAIERFHGCHQCWRQTTVKTTELISQRRNILLFCTSNMAAVKHIVTPAPRVPAARGFSVFLLSALRNSSILLPLGGHLILFEKTNPQKINKTLGPRVAKLQDVKLMPGRVKPVSRRPAAVPSSTVA